MKKVIPNFISIFFLLILVSGSLSASTNHSDDRNFCFNADVEEAQMNLSDMCLTAPVIMCPATYLGCPSDNLDPANTGTATASPGDISCPNPIVSYSDVVVTNTACMKVVHRTWEATYPPGSASIKLHSTCQQTLLLEDTTAPVISGCPQSFTVDLANNCAGIATWILPTASDDCGLQFFSTTNFSGTAFPPGTTTVTYTAQDMCGFQSTCSFNVTVVGSCCTGPTINCPGNYFACPGSSTDPSVTGTATSTQPDPSCPATTVTFSDVVTQNNGVCGQAINRTWTATDGTSSVSCVQAISTLDNQNPVITNFPSDMTLTGTGAGCSVVATWNTPTVTDNCGVASFTSTHSSGSVFSAGSTLVTFTAVDNCGNQTTAAFQVTVNCTVPCNNPIISCPTTFTTCPSNSVPSIAVSGNATATSSSGCTSGAPIVTHSDVVISSGPCAGQQQIQRTFTARDPINSSLASSCIQTINLIDNVGPTFSNVPSSFSLTGTGAGCQVPVTWTIPQANDACGVAMLSSNIQPGTLFTQGTTTVIYTAVDNCGNSNTTSFSVTITCNVPTCAGPPVISCPPTYNGCPSSGTISPSISGHATATSGGANCGTPSVTFTDVVTNTGGCNGSRVILRTWTAHDAVSGLTSSCVQTINLVDNTNPFFQTFCPGPITVTGTGNNCSAAAVYTLPVAADQCSAVTLTGTSNGQTVTSGSVFSQGTNLVTYTATDACGNFATCAFNVTVNCQGCNTNPTIDCPVSRSVCINTNLAPSNLGSASSNAGAFCPTPTVNFSDVTTSNGPCAGAKVVQRTWTSTYPGQTGFSASCIQIITVADNDPPIFTSCPSNITVTSSSTPVTWVTPSATDGCGAVQLTTTHNSGSVFPRGTTTVRYEARDNCGNVGLCSFNVTVNQPQGGFATCPSDITIACSGSSSSVATWPIPTYNGACNSCDQGAYIPGFIYMGSFGGSQFYCSLSPATWDSAKSICANNGGFLADITSAEENAFLASQLTIQSAWIGLSDTESEGNFTWCSNAPVSYNNWYPGQPNNYNGVQDYVELLSNGFWNDQYNSYALEFIMEIPCTFITQTAGPAPGTVLPTGTFSVSYSLQDACGDFATCNFNVVVESGLTVTCPSDINVTSATSSGTAVSWDPPAVHSCCSNCSASGGAIPGFIYMGSFNGSHYYCSLAGLDWASAQAVCQSNGGNLAVINSEAENSFLTNVIPLSSAWIGLNDIQSEGNFSWITGEPVTYTNWYVGQPNNYNGNQDAVELLEDGTWNDNYASLGLEYIMEISDCITTTQTAGPVPGSVVTPGVHTVSYNVVDGCGNASTCSFNITVTGPNVTGNGFCNAGGAISSNHHIKAVAFGQISNTSGDDGGYADYTNHCTTVAAGNYYPLQLTPGFGGAAPSKVFWSVWIDYNMDGDFYDNYEFVAYGCGSKTLSGSVTIPYGVWNGTTRARVSMKFGSYATDPCETFAYGETEDYCVVITGADANGGGGVVTRSNSLNSAVELGQAIGDYNMTVYPNPVSTTLTLTLSDIDQLESVSLFNIEGKLVKNMNGLDFTNQLDAKELENGIYLIRANYNDGTVLTERVIVQH